MLMAENKIRVSVFINIKRAVKTFPILRCGLNGPSGLSALREKVPLKPLSRVNVASI